MPCPNAPLRGLRGNLPPPRADKPIAESDLGVLNSYGIILELLNQD